MKRFVFILLVKLTHYHTVKEILKLTKICKTIITKLRTVNCMRLWLLIERSTESFILKFTPSGHLLHRDFPDLPHTPPRWFHSLCPLEPDLQLSIKSHAKLLTPGISVERGWALPSPNQHPKLMHEIHLQNGVMIPIYTLPWELRRKQEEEGVPRWWWRDVCSKNLSSLVQDSWPPYWIVKDCHGIGDAHGW